MKEEILVLLPIFAPTLAALEERYTVHKLWLAPDRPAFLSEVAPRVRIETRHPSRDHAQRWLETGEIDFRVGWS